MADDDIRVPAGWYPDPLGLPQLRWWDNHAWTEHVSDARQPMVAQETQQTRLAYAEPEPEELDEPVDERTIQLSRRARRERERQADEPDSALGAPQTAPAFGDPRLSLEAAERDQPVAEPAIMPGAALFDEAPSGSSYDLGTRFDDLLGESSIPRSAFAHASASTASLIPDATPEPDAAPLRARTHRADAEPRLGTAPVWIMTLLPLYMLVAGLLLLLAGNGEDLSTVAIIAMFAVTWVVGLVLAIVDWRLLKGQGVERPANPAWAVLGVLVYLIARLMRTVREAGSGFGPLLTFLMLGVVLLGAFFAVPGLLIQVAPATFAHQAEIAVESDASALGAHVVVQCPSVPPLLVQQKMVCDATRTTGDQEGFRVTVSLQRVNGWIDWRVDDWGVFTAS